MVTCSILPGHMTHYRESWYINYKWVIIRYVYLYNVNYAKQKHTLMYIKSAKLIRVTSYITTCLYICDQNVGYLAKAT